MGRKGVVASVRGSTCVVKGVFIYIIWWVAEFSGQDVSISLFVHIKGSYGMMAV